VAQVDLKIPFTRLPTKIGTAYPGRTEIYQPIGRIALVSGPRSLEAPGLLDTGASLTIFGTAYADALGLDWKTAPAVAIMGLGKSDNVGYVCQVRLVLSQVHYGWDARVAFCPTANTLPYGLLGHIGFLENFEVRFKSRERSARIFLK
jgi:hypothetical protein